VSNAQPFVPPAGFRVYPVPGPGLVWEARANETWQLQAGHGRGEVVWEYDRAAGAVQAHPTVAVGHVTFGRTAAAFVADALARFARCGEWRPPTRVCSVRGLTPAEADARGVVYVGRAHRSRDALSRGRVLFPEHPLHNPYRVPRGASAASAQAAVAAFRAHLRGDPALTALAKSLRGRLLGCWCGEWNGLNAPTVACHACEIALLAEEV